MKKTFLILLFIVTAGITSAQYNFAIGVRAGGTTGITLKWNNENSAVEGIIGFWNDGFSFTGLWERNVDAFNTSGFNWFYGWGGHVSVYGEEFDGKSGPAWFNHPNSDGKGDMGFGLDGVAGLEYKIKQIPFAFSVGIKPYVEVVTNGAFLFWIDPGFGIKFTF